MTTGEKLKVIFGLEKFNYIKIARILISSIKIYFIWYDSLRITMPVTTFRIRKSPYTAMIWRGIDLKRNSDTPPTYAPPIDIEDFNGMIENGLFFTIDLAGSNLIQPGNFSKKFRDNRMIFGTLKEFVTMADLMDTKNISGFTMDFRKDRSTIMGGENTQAKLLNVFLNKPDNSITFLFQTKATVGGTGKKLRRPPASQYQRPKKRTQPLNLSLIGNPEKKYEIQIKVLDFFDWLNVFEGDEITRKEIKEIMEVSNIQIFSSAPSFHWQGFNFWLSQIDGAMYPTDIAPKKWNKIHGDGDAFLDKHLYGLIRQMKFWYNPMASMLTKRLKDQEYL